LADQSDGGEERLAEAWVAGLLPDAVQACEGGFGFGFVWVEPAEELLK
jgi:hypothetical protein